MSGILVQRLAELNLIRDPASAGTKTLVISRHRKAKRRNQYVSANEILARRRGSLQNINSHAEIRFREDLKESSAECLSKRVFDNTDTVSTDCALNRHSHSNTTERTSMTNILLPSNKTVIPKIINLSLTDDVDTEEMCSNTEDMLTSIIGDVDCSVVNDSVNNVDHIFESTSVGLRDCVKEITRRKDQNNGLKNNNHIRNCSELKSHGITLIRRGTNSGDKVQNVVYFKENFKGIDEENSLSIRDNVDSPELGKVSAALTTNITAMNTSDKDVSVESIPDPLGKDLEGNYSIDSPLISTRTGNLVSIDSNYFVSSEEFGKRTLSALENTDPSISRYNIGHRSKSHRRKSSKSERSKRRSSRLSNNASPEENASALSDVSNSCPDWATLPVPKVHNDVQGKEWQLLLSTTSITCISYYNLNRF